MESKIRLELTGWL